MPRAWPAPDDRRCTRIKKDGTRCPNYAQHDSPEQLCNSHDGSLQTAMVRSFERKRILGPEPEEEERAERFSRAYERQQLRERTRRDLDDHYREADELDALDPDDTPLGRKLLRAIEDPASDEHVKRAAQWKLDQLRTGKVVQPQPAHPGPEVPPEEVQERLRAGWPEAFATSRSTDYRIIEGRPDPHEHMERRRPRSRWQDIPLVGR
jgi:hypothetical protein